MATQWEYDVVVLPIGINDVKGTLNQWASTGWEIITVIHQPSLKDRNKATESEYAAYLKRPQAKG